MRNNKIEEEEPAMEFHGLQTYMNAKRSNFFQSTFCSCGADMNWFCTFCDKSFNRKENNAKDTLFSNFAMLSPYFLQVLCVYNGFVANASILLLPGFDLYYNKHQNPFTFTRRGSFGIIQSGNPNKQKC